MRCDAGNIENRTGNANSKCGNEDLVVEAEGFGDGEELLEDEAEEDEENRDAAEGEGGGDILGAFVTDG